MLYPDPSRALALVLLILDVEPRRESGVRPRCCQDVREWRSRSRHLGAKTRRGGCSKATSPRCRGLDVGAHLQAHGAAPPATAPGHGFAPCTVGGGSCDEHYLQHPDAELAALQEVRSSQLSRMSVSS